MSLTREEKWDKIKDFYLRAGQAALGPKFRFTRALTDQEIDYLWESKQKLEKSTRDYLDDRFYGRKPKGRGE